ncbi:MAG TPA: hypothetical protein VGL40_03405 [Bacillota bacterium]|jgi:hypothetical protein
MVKISVGFGHTLNLGNYESARIDHAIEMDVPPEEVDAKTEELMAKAKAVVRGQIQTLMARNDIKK